MSRGRAATLLVVVMAMLAGCGLPEDGSPQAIAPENLPPDLLDPNPGSSTTLPESPGTTTIVVYLLEETTDGPRLIETDREVEDASQPGQRIIALLPGPTTEETNRGLSSVIPADTQLLSPVLVDEDASEVVIDLSSDIFTIEGEALAQAFAQIVYTVTEPDAGGYRAVRFLVDGEATTVLDGDGAEKDGAVSRADYTTFAPR